MKNQVILYTVTLTALLLSSVGCKTFRKAGDKASSVLGLDQRNQQGLDSDDLLDPLGARDGDRLLLDDLAPGQLATTWKARVGMGKDPESARQHYQRGQDLYNQGIAAMKADAAANQHQESFAKAANEFRLAAAAWPGSSTEEDALYFQGESYFFADRYVQSNRAFEKLVAEYNGSKHMDMAENRRYAIALYWLQLSDSTSGINLSDPKRPKTGLAKEARRVLHQIRMDDPTGRLADDAAMSLAKAFMKAKMYFEAGDTLEDLRRNYPGSEFQFDAHLLELEAQLASYQGPSYDDGPLRKADEIMKSIVRAFPHKSKGELAYLEKQSARIQNMLGQRDLTMGEYFERRGENLAARFHYQKIHEKFKGTEIANQIEQRIAATQSKPDRPAPPAEWLVNVFPDPEKAKPVIVAGDNESILGIKRR